MEKTITGLPVYRETRFRSPNRHERRCGLWVDRIGSGLGSHRAALRLRILGQYAAVAVESGEGILVSASYGRQAVRKDDVLLQTPREACAYSPRAKWFTRWIVWNGPGAQSAALAADMAYGAPIVRGGAAAVREAFFDLERLMDKEDVASAFERQAIILNLWAGLLRIRHAAEMKLNTRPDMEAAVRHIRSHLTSRLNLAELAALCHLSLPHFRRLFRRHTGRSPMEFLTAQRMTRAKELLAGGASIKLTAQEIGFADPLYFMRIFKQETGQTAGRFQSALREGSGLSH